MCKLYRGKVNLRMIWTFNGAMLPGLRRLHVPASILYLLTRGNSKPIWRAVGSKNDLRCVPSRRAPYVLDKFALTVAGIHLWWSYIFGSVGWIVSMKEWMAIQWKRWQHASRAKVQQCSKCGLLSERARRGLNLQPRGQKGGKRFACPSN